MLRIIYESILISTFATKALSAAVTASFGEKAVAPTTLGQIGINPITIYGPATQYIAPVGPHNEVLYVQDGQTKWKGDNDYYFTTAPVTRTVGDHVETEIAAIQVSASKATASAHGLDAGDLVITFTPDFKSTLEDFAADAVEACTLAIKAKRDPKVPAGNVGVATSAFTDCMMGQSVKGAQQGGRVAEAFDAIDLESGRLALPKPPPGPALEIDLWAASLQIAKNQVRKKEAWLLAIILTTYITTSTIYQSYRVPKQPVDVMESITTPTSVATCKPGAPTGANAVSSSFSFTLQVCWKNLRCACTSPKKRPVCSDDDCQGFPKRKKCELGEWKDCDCLGSVIYDGFPGLVNPSWLVLQAEVLKDMDSQPEQGIECTLEGNGKKLFNGSDYFAPPSWCLCAEMYGVPKRQYPTLPSTSALCAYTTLLASAITVKTLEPTPPPSLTTCRSFVTTVNQTAGTSCTCNDNKRQVFPTITDIGCGYYVEIAKTGTSSAEGAQPTFPPSQDVNGGRLYCTRDHHGPGYVQWYMLYNTTIAAIDQNCNNWDSPNLKWPIGPDQANSVFAWKVHINNVQPVNNEDTDVYFVVKWMGGDNCPVLDIGGKDKSEHCKNIYGTIIDHCDGDKDQNDYSEQGGRFERDCYRWQMAKKCDPKSDENCLFT